jgi:hypothetical protein
MENKKEYPTIDELSESQNVKPMMDVRTLFGTWPGEEDDDFEEAIDELRHRKEKKTMNEALCRAMAMFIDGRINLEEAIAGFKRMDTNIFTDKGIELLRSLDDLLNDWDFFDSKYRETIYEAVDMTGLDISNIGYEDDK